MRLACLFFLPLGLVAAENTGFTRLHEDLQAIDDAHSRQGAEVAAWRGEDERLALACEGLRAQLTRIQAQVVAGEANRDAMRGERERLAGGEVLAAQQTLAESARTVRAQLQHLAATLPPGTLAVPADDTPESLLKALELSARAVDQVGVTIAAGHRAGDPPATRTAVRLLRAAGLAWWIGLDGREAGSARMSADALELDLATPADQDAIRRAVAIAEGRLAAEPIVLPLAGGQP